MNKILTIRGLLFSISILICTTGFANPSISLSAKLQPTGFDGNDNSGENFESTGNLWSIGASVQQKKLYGGITIQGGHFTFDSLAPDMISTNSATSASDVIIDHGELDIYAGYYFWPNVSLFLDIKSITNSWRDKNYSVNYSGLGLGISGFYPMTPPWIAYGSFGFVPLRIEEDGKKIGSGNGSALELGAIYKIADQTNLSFGLKFQNQTLEFDFENRKQEHSRAGLNIGIQHRFWK